MTAICVIGDSHVAALKQGWDNVQGEFHDVRLSFLAAPGGRLKNLAVVNGKLAPASDELRRALLNNAGGISEIGGGYDGYIVCGLKFGVSYVAQIQQRYRLAPAANDDRHPLSEDCLLRAAAGSLHTSVAAQTVMKLRQITDAPIGLLPIPMRNEEEPIFKWPWIRQNAEEKTVAAVFAIACDRLEKDLNIQIFQQPAATLSSPLSTKSSYAQGATRLSGKLIGELRGDDYRHMNASYGALCLRRILASAKFGIPSRAEEVVLGI
jgi:hypothetical protein